MLVGRDFAGVDITREPIRIKPGNHYTMGGVKTDVDGGHLDPRALRRRTRSACVSVPRRQPAGANSLLDTLIFGRRAGQHAASAPSRSSSAARSEAALADAERRIAELIGREPGNGRRVSEVRNELGETMDQQVAVFRDRRGIQLRSGDGQAPSGGGQVAYIDDRGTVFNQDVLGAIELDFMLDCAECTCVAALHRTESRGAQYRTDFPGAQRRRVAEAHRRHPRTDEPEMWLRRCG